jgi:sec-independent protein translocase protein TatA
MGALSLWHWAIVLAVAILLLGGPRVARAMGDFGRGLKLFRHTMRDGTDA